jgi:hypothetical protein
LSVLAACDATSGFVIESRRPVSVAAIYQEGDQVRVPLDGQEADGEAGVVFRYVIYDTNVVHVPHKIVIETGEGVRQELLWREPEGVFVEVPSGDRYALHGQPRDCSEFSLIFYRRLTLFDVHSTEE